METITQADFERLEKKLDSVLMLLTGNGTPEKGVIVRLDRLEQWRAFIEADAEEKQDTLNRIFLPILTDSIKFAAAGGAFVIIGHAFGILH